MNDLKLDNNHDLQIVNFDLLLVQDSEAIMQNVKQTLLMFKGEWFLDNNAGIPWIQSILGQKNSLASIKSILLAAISNVFGVEEITSFEVIIDNTTRNLALTIEILDIFNEKNKIQFLI